MSKNFILGIAEALIVVAVCASLVFWNNATKDISRLEDRKANITEQAKEHGEIEARLRVMETNIKSFHESIKELNSLIKEMNRNLRGSYHASVKDGESNNN